MRQIQQQIPFAIAATVFLVLLALLTYKSIQTNDGVLVYTLDDPYIHMAMAKNLSEHGIFGVTSYAFSSSTSSPLWTLLLALFYKIVGVSDWIPGILATCFGLLMLYEGHSLCRMINIQAFGRIVVCLFIVYFTPLIAVVSTGMEHAMHAYFALILLHMALAFANNPERRTLLYMCIGGFCAVATRYESLFLAAPLGLWLISLKHWKAAVLLGILSCAPVVIYGIFSVFNGSFFLPNSLMLKGTFPSIDGLEALINTLGFRGFSFLTKTKHLYVICILLLLGCSLVRKTNRHLSTCALCIVGTILLHLQFATTGWFYRYESYLIVIAWPIMGGLYCGLREILFFQALDWQNRTTRGALFLCTVLFLWPLHCRAKQSFDDVVPASHHIYRQQYHMARFLRQMYPAGGCVALNDLGAVAYYTNAKILDLWGLGTIEVTRAKRNGQFTADVVRQLLEFYQPQVIMLYADCFVGRMPDILIPAAEWTIRDNYFRKTVTFYALSDAAANDLKQRLIQYQRLLPESVEVIYYTAVLPATPNELPPVTTR